MVSNSKLMDGGAFGFDVGDESFACSLMPAPYPNLPDPLTAPWLWPPQPSVEIVKQHRAHLLIVVLGGSSDPVRQRLVLTAVTALAARQAGVLAIYIYWPEARFLHFPPLFIEMAEKFNSPQSPPLYLWVNLPGFLNEDGTAGLFTIGLSTLGHMEIEIPRIAMKVGELREWVFNIIYIN